MNAIAGDPVADREERLKTLSKDMRKEARIVTADRKKADAHKSKLIKELKKSIKKDNDPERARIYAKRIVENRKIGNKLFMREM